MYCPRCGERQNSGNLRFCSKCGLPMGLVSEVLSNGGSLPQLEELYNKKSGIFTRKNGVFFSLFWFILFVPFGAAFWGVLDVEELAAISAVFGVFSSILILLFSLFFLGKPKNNMPDHLQIQNHNAIPQNLSGHHTQTALPPQQTQPAEDYISPQAGMWKAPETDDLVQPGSVTEGTTKLLTKEEQEEQNTRYFNQ